MPRAPKPTTAEPMQDKKEVTKVATTDTGISIDFSNVKSFEPVETGTYGAVFTGSKVRDNKAGDGKVLNCEFTIEGESDELDGRKLFRGFSLKPQALWALKEFLITCGVDEDEVATNTSLDDLVAQADGAHVLLNVSKNENSTKPGKYYNNVEDIKAE